MAWFDSGLKSEAVASASHSKRPAPVRAVALAAFALAAGTVAACGHQVTPEPNLANSDLAGDVFLRFDTVAPLNFSSFSYAVIINTCGSGAVPYPNVFGTSFLSYSYGFFVGGSIAGSSQVSLIQYYFNGGNVTQLPIPLNPSQVQFNPDSNGLGTEFTLTFSRSLLNNHFNIGQPCPNVTQPPATPVPTGATPAPTAGPTTAPTGGATAVPTASANPYPTTAAQSTWIFNYMTFNTSRQPQDSLGPGGPNDTQFQGVDIDVNTLTLMPIFRQQDQAPPSNQSAQIAGGEIDNYP
jgi:hypothetical protein